MWNSESYRLSAAFQYLAAALTETSEFPLRKAVYVLLLDSSLFCLDVTDRHICAGGFEQQDSFLLEGKVLDTQTELYLTDVLNSSSATRKCGWCWRHCRGNNPQSHSNYRAERGTVNETTGTISIGTFYWKKQCRNVLPVTRQMSYRGSGHGTKMVKSIYKQVFKGLQCNLMHRSFSG